MVGGVADFSIKDALNMLPESKAIMSMTYHGNTSKGKTRKNGQPVPPTWWDVHCPDGLRLTMTDQLAAFLIAVGGVAALFAFWDVLVAYLDKQGYRKMDEGMWKDLMGLGVLGGFQDLGNDWDKKRNELIDWLKKATGG